MSWFNTIRNYTRNESSRSSYKLGRAPMQEILKDNPGWTHNDVIVGGGPQGGYFLIAGWDRFSITNQMNDGASEGYDIAELDVDTDCPVTECTCGCLLHYGTVLAVKDKDYYMPWTTNDNDFMEHCSRCHRVWDGFAQCMCDLD